ncbi:MAG: alpha/beta hydrolase [Terracidiphilus sp.]|jgi:pimeloyl-ACP methyl ester carboxylesterase
MVGRLILLPGMHGSGELFAAFMHMIPKPKHIQALHYPNDATWTHEQLLLDVKAFVPESEPYFLLAESFSTPLAIQFAATRPANLNGLILCAGFASSPIKGWRRLFARVFAPISFRVGIPNSAMNLLAGPNAPDALVAALRKAISAVQPSVLASRARIVLACDATAELSQVNVPILYLLAKQDRVVPVSCLDEILRIRPDVKLVAIDAPHLLMQREPQQAAAAVAEFIQRIESAK